MKKSIYAILAFTTFFLSSLPTYSAVTEVSCSSLDSGITNSCDQCFDGGHVYQGTARTINDTFINGTSQRAIYYLDENPDVGSFDVLQTSSTWSTTPNLLTYTPGLDLRLGGGSGRLFYNFEPNTSTLFLDTISGSGIRFDDPGVGTDRNEPAYKFTFTANYHLFNGTTLGAQQEHNECLFYSPAWCGDGVTDAVQGEQCDDGNTDETDGCNNSCQVVTPTTFDLALIKEVNGAQTSFAAGETVTFDITVTNQGNVAATNTVITDYIPTGLTLADANWTQNGTLATRTIPTIAPGTSEVVSISFTVDNTASGQIVNWAEISSDSGDDIDSTPNQNNLDDCHGGNGGSGTGVNTIDPLEDDTIDGTGDLNSDNICQEGEDEDDHDPAVISVEGFDLALRKTLSGSTNIVTVGDSVTFNIEVFNQGDITATNTVVTDYIPTGLTLNDTSWTLAINSATRIIPTIAPGASEVISITFTVNNLSIGTVTNTAEISSDSGDDCDSVADNNANNDGNIDDDDIGTGCEPGGDEDDHDIAPITVQALPDEYDLALAKTLSGTVNTVSSGSLVTFNIAVTNQGDVVANNIEVTDYIPTGLTLTDANWTQNGSLATRTIPTIAIGTTETVSITFTVDGTVLGTINNFAEISADDGDDCDSTPDNTNGNQVGETIGAGLVDDDIGTGCEPGGDEDDHDIAPITVTNTVVTPSINVLKYSANPVDSDGNTDDSNITNDTQTITSGSDAIFRIVVTNDGTEDLNTVILTDTLAPACSRTSTQTLALITAIGNNDGVFNIGESFSYDCTDTSITADYTNSITVTALGVVTNTPVTDTDTSLVNIPGGGGSGGSTPRCYSISTQGTQITCTGNSRVGTFRIDCDTTSTDDENIFTTNITRNASGRYEASEVCTNGANNPICYVHDQEVSQQVGPSTIGIYAWRTENACNQEIVNNPECGNAVVEPSRGEECEPVDSDGNTNPGCTSSCKLNVFGTSTLPSQTGILTYPQGGNLIFDIRADDVVIGHGTKVSDVIGDIPQVTNDTPYDLALPELCLIKQSGTSLVSAPAQGPSFYTNTPTHGYCADIGDILYPGETQKLFDLSYGDFTATTAGMTEDFEDNVIAFTVKDDQGKVYDTAYFASNVTVRVAKPSVATTAGTAYFEDSFISNLAELDDDLNGLAENDANTNFGGIVISDEENLGDTATVQDDDNQVEQSGEEFVQENIEDLSAPSSTLSNYNGLDNVFVINGTDLRASTLPDTVDESTTFIIENADLIIDEDIAYDYNTAFIVRGGNVVVANDVTAMDGSYVAIPKADVGGNITGASDDSTNNRLIVSGSLYGDTSDLIGKRTFVRSANDGQINVGTIVSFGSSFFRDPAPLLGSFISEYTNSTKVAQ